MLSSVHEFATYTKTYITYNLISGQLQDLATLWSRGEPDIVTFIVIDPIVPEERLKAVC
jgi:hypothetical protein